MFNILELTVVPKQAENCQVCSARKAHNTKRKKGFQRFENFRFFTKNYDKQVITKNWTPIPIFFSKTNDGGASVFLFFSEKKNKSNNLLD